MPKHPRLMKRGNTYWHRAAIPADIKATYPKSEETFSLGTKDPMQALVAVRKAAAEVDVRFDTHRRQQAAINAPAVLELTAAQIARIEELYYHHLLDEDDEVRLAGFFEKGEALPVAPVPSFDEYVDSADSFGADARYMLARGKSDDFYRQEMEEVLTWNGLGMRLDDRSPSWKPAMRAIQSAIVRAQTAIAARNQGDVVPTPQVADARLLVRPSGVLASVARGDWISEKGRSTWVAKTKHEHSVWSQHFLDLVGDRPVGSYGKADGRAFKLALQKLPPNWVKQCELRGLSFREATEKAADLGLPPMSDTNINKIIGFVAAFWNWAAENYDEVTGNPFERLKIKVRGSARDDRDPFSSEQLATIFKAPVYTGCLSDRRWAHQGDLVLRDFGRFWVPLISLFSGARLGEVIQLRLEDIRRDAGVLHFSLVDEGEDQRLKTTTSRRRIPVHPQLLELGFGQLVEQRRSEKAVRLFPELPMGEDGYYSSPFSKYFGRFLKVSGAAAPKTSFHSFRHNFEDACRNVDVPFEVMNTLQGHGESGMAKRYGKGYVLQHLDKWVRQIRYDDLDLSHLIPPKGR